MHPRKLTNELRSTSAACHSVAKRIVKLNGLLDTVKGSAPNQWATSTEAIGSYLVKGTHMWL